MDRTWRRGLRILAACTLLLAAQPAPAGAAADPFEAVNRRVHAFNQDVRTRLLGPLADLYHAHTTPRTRRGVANALANLSEPITAVSGLAAGDLGLARDAAARFGINSTLGLAGLRDRAAAMGYPRRAFGVADALCRWQVPSGPFLVLPLLGPSTVRDAGALVAASAALSQALGSDVVLAWSTSDALVAYAGLHHALDRIDAEALDAYAVYRSAYLQRRAAACPADAADPSAEDAGAAAEAP